MMKNGNLNETQMVMQLFLKYRYCLNQYNEKEKESENLVIANLRIHNYV